MEKHILLGRIVKLHGVNGEVTVSTEQPLTEKLPELKMVFLEIDGKMVPFFVESCKGRGEKTLILKFERYNHPSKVNEFNGCNVYITAAEKKKTQKIFNWNDLKGYRVISKNREISGIITTVTDNQGNILLEILTDKGTAMFVPFHSDLVISFDRKRKSIEMDLPEGLEDINL